MDIVHVFFLKIRSNKGRVSKPQSRNPSVKGVGRGIPLSSVYFSPFVMTSRPLSQGWFGAFQKASDFEYTGFPKPKPKLCKLWNCTNDTSDHRKSIPLLVDFGKLKSPSRTEVLLIHIVDNVLYPLSQDIYPGNSAQLNGNHLQKLKITVNKCLIQIEIVSIIT